VLREDGGEDHHSFDLRLKSRRYAGATST
jgi:hypothetical protein